MSKLTLEKLWDWPIYNSHLSSEEKRKIRHRTEPIAALSGILVGVVVGQIGGSAVVTVLSAFVGAYGGYCVARYALVMMQTHLKTKK